MKKYLILLLALLLSLSLLLCACNNEPDIPDGSGESQGGTSDSDTSPESEGKEESGTLKIFENGVFNYSIIRAESMPKQVLEKVSALYNSIVNLTGAQIEFSTDYNLDYVQSGVHNPELCEIVIGVTNYDETEALMQEAGYGNYVYRVIGNKIFVLAISDEILSRAITDLEALLTNAYDSETKSIVLESSDIERTVNCNATIDDIPAFLGGTLEQIFDCGGESQTLIFKKSDLGEFEKYVDKLKDDTKYQLISERSMNNNPFYVFSSDDIILNVSYTAADKKTRISYDLLSKYDLPRYDKNYTSDQKICDSLLIQIGVNPDDNEAHNGMSYLVRCEDGTFIVYDGGWGSNETGTTPRNNVQLLYRELTKYTPKDMKPTISAWIITHQHGDHVGAVSGFIKKYSNQVDVDQFVYNFPAEDQPISTSNDKDGRVFDELISQYYPNADRVKSRAGEVMKIANIEIEFLYSLELFASTTTTYFNDSSTVSRLFVGGQSILMSGDMAPDPNEILCKYFKDYLKSDFYQVSHHGGNGGSNAFNKLCDPKWVLWPRGSMDWSRVMGLDRNSYLTGSGSKVEKIFPAWYQTTVINLPFNGSEDGYTVYDN